MTSAMYRGSFAIAKRNLTERRQLEIAVEAGAEVDSRRPSLRRRAHDLFFFFQQHSPRRHDASEHAAI